jgi:uncharacterized protein YcnI
MNVRNVALALVAAGALVAAPAAGAHVSISPSEAPAGSSGFFELTVSHGCDESPTTRLTVKMPDGITSATPEAVPGWDARVTTRTLDEPVEAGHGETVSEVVDTISWEGGPLPSDQLARFGVSVRLPESAGTTLYFPTVQECETGETRWIQIPLEGQSEEDLDEPAPAVSLVAADGAHNGGEAADDSSSGSSTLAIALGAAGLAVGLCALVLVLARRPRT